MSDAEIYNPLDRRHLGESIVGALLTREVHSLGDLKSFRGAGVYVIYYKGGHNLYSPISLKNQDSFAAPIYVGKAVPKGGRKGIVHDASARSSSLYGRLSQHAESIRCAGDFSIEDFHCRYLAVEDIWIGLGESLLIQSFKPVWNRIVDGFGNHDPGQGRYEGRKPLWDELHPGRPWASRCKKASLKTREEIIEAVRTWLVETP